MELTHRMRQILDLLLHSPYDITVAEIARQVGVSSRTVHRELDAVESYLHRRGVLLRRKAGSGLGLEGGPEKLEELSSQLQTPEEAEFTSDERQIYLLGRLLGSREPAKLFALAAEMKVTVPTVSSDLDALEDWIGRQRLLLVRRRGYGVEVNGSEPAIREAIRALLRLRIDDLALIAQDDNRLRHPLDAGLAGLAGPDRIPALEKALWQWENEGRQPPLSEEAYTDLLLLLAIAAERSANGYLVSDSELLPLEAETADSDAEFVQAMKRDAASSDRLCLLLEREADLNYPAAERRYVACLLDRAADRSGGELPAEDLEFAAVVRRLIGKMEELGGIAFSGDRSLRDGLYTHLKAALERIGAGQRIRNPLLDAVRKDYAELFAQVRAACDAALPAPKVPDEEVAFLVMHFGASRERLRQVRQNLRAIIVCTSGIGSSKMLAVRLGKEFPQLNIVQQASWYEASRISETEYDLIISTVDLPLPAGKYMKLSPLLTPAEAEKLREFIRSRSEKERRQQSGERPVPLPQAAAQANPPDSNAEFDAQQNNAISESAFAGGTEALHSLNRAVQQAVSLLDDFRVIKLTASQEGLGKLLLEACSREELRHEVTDPSAVAMQLMQRELQGTQMIPDTDLALFHTRSEWVRKPVLLLFELEQPIVMAGADTLPLKRFLLMLAPRSLDRESLEVLSEISATLLDKAMIERLASGREREIRKLFADYLTLYMNHKLESE